MMVLPGPSLELDWIQVELSASCTGSCVYCPVSRFRGRRREGFMTEEMFRRLEASLASASMVFLQGWGEPLLDPDFWERVARVRASGPRVGFTTNGMHLDRGNRRALLESGVEILGVSLAGGTAETHDRFRAGNPLATVDDHLRELRKEKEEMGADVPKVHLAYQLLASNLSELPRVLDLAEDWGAAQVVVSNLDLVLSRELEKEALTARPDLQEEVGRRLDQARTMAEEQGIAFRAYRHGFGAPRPACTENVLRSCFIAADGSVAPCVMLNAGVETEAPVLHRFREEYAVLPTLTFGNLAEDSLETIWRSRAARGFRRVFRDRIWKGRRDTEKLPPGCRRCNKLYEA